MASTTSKTIELPPPAWGSPAHQIRVKAEKEWKRHLRALATVDAKKHQSGKQARFVEDVDIVVRYSLPPQWDLLSGEDAPIGEDAIWRLPEDDEVLVRVLNASFAPFFQRTGDSKISSPAKPVTTAPKKPSPVVATDVEKGVTNPPVADEPRKEDDAHAIRPRRTYLPLFLTNFLNKIAHIFVVLIPSPLRRRIHNWWSPVQGRPVGRP